VVVGGDSSSKDICVYRIGQQPALRKVETTSGQAPTLGLKQWSSRAGLKQARFGSEDPIVVLMGLNRADVKRARASLRVIPGHVLVVRITGSEELCNLQ
jgi:hypothetical protein